MKNDFNTRFENALEQFVSVSESLFKINRQTSISLEIGESVGFVPRKGSLLINFYSFDKLAGYNDSFPVIVKGTEASERYYFKPLNKLNPLEADTRLSTVEYAASTVTYLATFLNH